MKYLIYINLLIIICVQSGFTQNFEFNSVNPYGLKYFSEDTTEVAIKFYFYDIDGDKDLDAISIGLKNIEMFDQNNPSLSQLQFFISVQVNIGNNRNPQFGEIISLNNSLTFPSGFFTPAFGDINNDGIMDIWVCCDTDESLNLKPVLYKGKKEGLDLSFDLISSDSLALNSFPAGSFLIPELKDMDLDGDLDIIMSGFVYELTDDDNRVQTPVFYYGKNNGTASEPKISGWYPNPYNFNPEEQIHLLFAGDIDNDGDNDFLSYTSNDDITYFGFFENSIQNDKKPWFTQFPGSILNLPIAGEDESLFIPTLADLDGDGDIDVYVLQNIQEIGGLVLYLNKNCDGVIDNSLSVTANAMSANSSGLTYQWIDCNDGKEITGETNRSYSPTKSGRYEVRITSPSTGCIAYSDCVNFIVSSTNDLDIANKILLNPNPAGTFVEILNHSALPVKRVTFVNSVGLIIAEYNYQNKANIDISAMSEGSYILKIEVGDYVVSKKLVIVK